jgi:hypothetical protein
MSDMAKKQVSILVPERLVDLADQTGAMVGQSRAFVMTRWMLESLVATEDEVVEYFPRGLSTANGAQDYGNISQELQSINLEMAKAGSEKLAQYKKNCEVSATSGEGADSGLPDPGFGEMGENTGIPSHIADLQPTTWPEYGGIPRGEFPKVPDEVANHLRGIYNLMDKVSGADPRILNDPEKPGARTAAGIERVDQQLTKKATVPKSKKIARVAPSPDPGNAHDPKSCRIYGCLMCKAAKEEF